MLDPRPIPRHRSGMKRLLLALLLVTVPALAGQPDWMKPQPTLLQKELQPRTAAEQRANADFMRRIAEAQRALDAAEQREAREQIAEILAALQAIQVQGRR